MPAKKGASKGAVRVSAGKRKSSPAARPKRKTDTAPNFAAVFTALKKVLSAHAAELHASQDEPRKYYLVTKSKSWRGGPMFFGAVIWGKAYVSYHLLPLYMYPEMKKLISPALRRRMQGKACFNFSSQDDGLLAELGDLTKSALEAYRDKKLL